MSNRLMSGLILCIKMIFLIVGVADNIFGIFFCVNGVQTGCFCYVFSGIIYNAGRRRKEISSKHKAGAGAVLFPAFSFAYTTGGERIGQKKQEEGIGIFTEDETESREADFQTANGHRT